MSTFSDIWPYVLPTLSLAVSLATLLLHVLGELSKLNSKIRELEGQNLQLRINFRALNDEWVLAQKRMKSS